MFSQRSLNRPERFLEDKRMMHLGRSPGIPAPILMSQVANIRVLPPGGQNGGNAFAQMHIKPSMVSR
jgi:hypothetical protein